MFRTTSAFVRYTMYESAPTRYLLSADEPNKWIHVNYWNGVRPAIAAPTPGINHNWREPKLMGVVLLGEYDNEPCSGCLVLMAIDTESRGVSRRKQLIETPIRAEEWAKHKPKERTIYLV